MATADDFDVQLGIGPKGGRLRARVRLRFAVAVNGPLMLGRDSHMGGGLFVVTGREIDAG